MYDPTKAPANFSKDLISIFSPITPVCSINFSATVIPLKSAAKNASLVSKFKASAAKSVASFTKPSFFPTKSVSQFNVITTPAVLSAFTTAMAAPSVDSLSERLAATF